MTDQPTAEQALKELEVLVGEWSQEAIPPGGEPWPGEATTTFEWLEGSDKRLLIERSTIEMPEAPDSVCVIGCDAAKGTYYQLYTDDRNVCRVYEMSIGQRRVEALARGRALQPALHGQDLRGRQPDRGTVGGRRGRRLEDRLRPDLHQGQLVAVRHLCPIWRSILG